MVLFRNIGDSAKHGGDKGELIPVGGGETIPLLRERLTIGRRESCDICLKFPNVSGQHCELFIQEGLLYVQDLGSTNGVKVNGKTSQQRVLRPGDEIAIANRRFTIQYTLPSSHHAFQAILDEDISQPLLEKAGLAHPPRPASRGRRRAEEPFPAGFEAE